LSVLKLAIPYDTWMEGRTDEWMDGWMVDSGTYSKINNTVIT